MERKDLETTSKTSDKEQPSTQTVVLKYYFPKEKLVNEVQFPLMAE